MFRGGCGNDTFDGGDGIDRMILGGARDDYEVTLLDDGAKQITDLRRNSPDGVDLCYGVEILVFDTGSCELS